ncbi:MAG: nitroreductase family protein [Firmicutes bacterium]|nr:nitroreductase family protein [Bacillota bacterium]
MNDTLTNIAKRYSCRSFTDKVIADADLRAIADAAIQAPSAMNRQGWHFAVVKNKALLSEIEAEGMRVLSELADKSSYNRIVSRGGKLFYSAQAVVFIAVPVNSDAALDRYTKYAPIDLGIAAQNVSLAATSLGIANCHCGLVAFCFASDKADCFKQKLNFPAGFECSYGVLLGYARESGTPHATDVGKISFIE